MWGLLFEILVNSVLFFHPAQASWNKVFSFTFFCPAQVSWSDVFSFNIHFFFCLAKLSQCNDFCFSIPGFVNMCDYLVFPAELS